MRIRMTITIQTEYDVKLTNYPEGLTATDMLELDKAAVLDFVDLSNFNKQTSINVHGDIV